MEVLARTANRKASSRVTTLDLGTRWQTSADGIFYVQREREMMKRYAWEDALIEAQTSGHLVNGALLVALKLARAINWSPKDGKEPGLYWKNEDALKSVGCSRASFYRHRQSLVETGFFEEVNGNLIPRLPESLPETPKSQIETDNDTQKSLPETEKSLVETPESLVETEKSLGDNPFSVDTFSEDTLSEELSVDNGPVAADASPTPSFLNLREEEASPNLIEEAALSEVEEFRESLVETTHEWDSRTGFDWLEIKKVRPLTAEENDYLNAKSRAYLANKRPAVEPKYTEEW